MPDLSELQFAVKYPFTSKAKQVMQAYDVALDNIDPKVRLLAQERIFAAFQRKPQQVPETNHQEILRNVLLSFPVAKLVLAQLQDAPLKERFAESIAQSVFAALEKEQHQEDMSARICRDLGIALERSENMFLLPLLEYLKADLSLPQLRLVNQRISNGKVLVSSHLLSRWLSALAAQLVSASLVRKPEELPENLKLFAQQVDREVTQLRLKFAVEQGYGNSEITGPANIEMFPECMRLLYLRLQGGENVPHLGRFDLATFLIAVHLPMDAIVELFRCAPNFDERTTRYHLENIQKKGYAPPSCSKLREHGFACAKCTMKHPLNHYRREQSNLAQKAAELEKSGIVVDAGKKPIGGKSHADH